jgi:hypothetical protein
VPHAPFDCHLPLHRSSQLQLDLNRGAVAVGAGVLDKAESRKQAPQATSQEPRQSQLCNVPRGIGYNAVLPRCWLLVSAGVGASAELRARARGSRSRSGSLLAVFGVGFGSRSRPDVQCPMGWGLGHFGAGLGARGWPGRARGGGGGGGESAQSKQRAPSSFGPPAPFVRGPAGGRPRTCHRKLVGGAAQSAGSFLLQYIALNSPRMLQSPAHLRSQ